MGLLDGKKILVTNVTDFVGLPVVEACAAEGADVLAQDARYENGKAPSLGERVFTTAESDPDVLVAEMVAQFGRIDVLVGNDGFPAIRATVEDHKSEDMRQGLEALVVRPFALAGAVTRAMKDQEATGDKGKAAAGRMVFITSAAPLRGLSHYGMYATARGAQNSMVISLSRELAKHGITVNAVAPNFVESPTYFPPDLLANEDAKAKILANIPLGRLGKPEEVASLAAFLASDRCGFMTGRILPVDGGWS